MTKKQPSRFSYSDDDDGKGITIQRQDEKPADNKERPKEKKPPKDG